MPTPEQIRARIAELDAADAAPPQDMDRERILARIAELDAADAEQQDPRVAQAALQGFGEGATLGYLPQLQAAGEQVIDFFTPEPESDRLLKEQGFKLPEEPGYIESRDAFIQRGQQLQDEAPVAFGVGQVAGGLAATAPLGAAVTMKGAAVTGAAYGALQNPGDIEGELSPLQLDKRIKNTAYGALTGLLAQGGVKAIAKASQAIRSAPGAIKTLAEARAAKATGMIYKDIKKMHSPEQARAIGRVLLDKKLIHAGEDVADVAKKTFIERQNIGNQVGELFSDADKILLKSSKTATGTTAKVLNKSRINLSDFAKSHARVLKRRLRGRVGATDAQSSLNKMLEEIGDSGNNVGLRKLHEIRQSIDKQINWGKATKDLPLVQQELKVIRKQLDNMAKARFRAVDRLAGGKRVAQLNKINKEYSAMATANDIAQDHAKRLLGNRFLGMSEQIGGGAGATIGTMVGGPAGGVVGGMAGIGMARFARQYGSPIVAKTADRVAKMLEGPEGKKALGAYADDLIQKLASDPKEFVLAIQALRNDPDFKRRVKK